MGLKAGYERKKMKVAGGRSMDIREIYAHIQAHVENQSFLLNEETTKVSALGQLCEVFGMEGLHLQEFVCVLREDELELRGIFTVSQIYQDLHIELLLTSGGRIHAAFTVPEMKLDSGGLFVVQNAVFSLKWSEGEDFFAEDIAGKLDFGGIAFRVSSQRLDLWARRQFEVQSAQELDAMAFVNAALSLLGMDLAMFGLEKTRSFMIKEFVFTYTAGSNLLTAEEAVPSEIEDWNFNMWEEEDFSDDYFEWKIKTDIGFQFQNKFGLEEIGFRLEKYGRAYDLAMEGVMTIFGAKCPFFISFGNERFSISMSQCKNVQLDNVEDMGLLAGETNILKNFPADFKPSGMILLHMLNLEVSSDFKQILGFQIAVLLDYQWQFCKTPDLQLSEILISFSYQYGQNCFGISGQLRFCEIDTIISAAVLIGEKKMQWRFCWRMFDDETIDLTEFLGRLANSLGVSAPQMGLPKVEIGNVAAEYVDGAFSLQLMILVSDSSLFSSQTSIQIQSCLRDNRRDYTALVSWISTNHALTVEHVLVECGLESAVMEIPDFIRRIGLDSLELRYDFLEGRIDSKIQIQTIGTLELTFVFQGEKAYWVRFAPEIKELSFANLPVVGTLVKQALPPSSNFTLTDLKLNICSGKVEEQVSEGLGLEFSIMGEKKVCMLVEKKSLEADILEEDYAIRMENWYRAEDVRTEIEDIKDPFYVEYEWEEEIPLRMMEDGEEQEPKMVWLNVHKTLAIFTLHRIGVGLDGAHVAFAVDAALQVSPLTFTLTGAGIGVNLSDPTKLKFYITGFGISFQNELLSISGEFVQDKDAYSGELLIRVKQICAAAIAEYSKDGSLMAFAAVTANFGGPPAFLVTGIAFGFGYHKKLILPDINQVSGYPLIEAAKGKCSREDLSGKLKMYFVSEKGQKFLAAGVRFTSFGIVDTSAILTISFGNNFEIGLLGLSELTMPPKSSSVIAYAGLALRAALKPEEGSLQVEARLTSESYILSKDCKLTGGFALYLWFSGEHNGDFVITLGGYKSGYQKPAHYPDVPRVGFHWQIGEHLNLSGELYFALTPKEIMAGGRLSAVYAVGKLRAYFIAALDLYLAWKPFAYEASLQVLLGVSYRVDFWFVHHTFTIELGAGLHIWGPEFAGTAHISWFILSFDISFGNTKKEEKSVGWEEFVQSFLPQNKKVGAKQLEKNEQQASPLTITYRKGLLQDEKETLCRADELQIQIESAMPMTEYQWNQPVKTADSTNRRNALHSNSQNLYIQPMKEAKLENCLFVELQDENKQYVDADIWLVKKNLPSALWGRKRGEALVMDAACGLVVVPKPSQFVLFPIQNAISLEQLYLLGTIMVKDAFAFQESRAYPTYSTKDSLKVISDTVETKEVQKSRREFLKRQGIVKEISLAKIAANARNLFSEEVMVKE